MHGAIGELGQYRPAGTITLAGFTRVLLAYTFIVAQRHACPRGQAQRGLKLRYINADPRSNDIDHYGSSIKKSA